MTTTPIAEALVGKTPICASASSQTNQYVVAMEAALLVPETGVSIFPWKEPEVQIPLAVRQIHSSTGPIRPLSGRWHYARAGVAASSTILGRDRIFNSPITCGHYFQLTEVYDGSVTAKSANKVSNTRSTPPSVAARILSEFAIPTRSDAQKPGERAPHHVRQPRLPA